MSDRSEVGPGDAADGVADYRAGDSRAARARRRLQAQWTVTATLARALTPPEVTRAVLSALLDALDVDAASIACVNAEHDGVLQVTEAARRGRDTPCRIAERSVAPSSAEPIAVAAREGRPVFRPPSSAAVATLADAPAAADAGGAASAAAVVPLVVAGRSFGVLYLAARGDRGLDDDERAFVLAVAQQYAETTERARLLDAEHRARARAEAASRAKSEFLAIMSHEIRTPLNAVVGYTDLLDLGIAGPVSEPQRGYLHRIRASSKHLLTIVNDVLDFSKVEAGRLVVANAEASARAAVDAVVALVHAQAAQRSIALVSRADADGDVRYCGDARRVEQILLNLLSNALRFTPPSGRVTVSFRRTGGAELPRPTMVVAEHWCAIDVEDTGIGIAADHLPTIFDPFVQVDSGHTRAYGGSGLGLAISRRLARAMDGDVTVRSVSGEGSTFTLLLPGMEGDLAAGRRGTAASAMGAPRAVALSEVGDAVLADVDVIVKRYMERLRIDPKTPSAHAMKDTELQDHSAIFVSDIAQALGIAAEAEGPRSTLMRHDHDIQNLIADRHGELRHHLGWTEPELDRDFEILWEEIERTVRRTLPADDPNVVDALARLKRFIDRADETSRRAYRRKAAATTDPLPERPRAPDAAEQSTPPEERA